MVRRSRGSKRWEREIVNLSKHEEKHVSVGALARYFGVERKTIVKWIHADSLPGYRYQGVLRVKTSDALAFEQKSRIRSA